MAVDAGDECEATNVKLSILVQKWVGNVLLQDDGAAILAAILDFVHDVGELRLHHDSDATVGILARLDNPNVLHLVLSVVLIIFFVRQLVSFILFLELLKSDIIEPRSDMKSKWQSIKDVLIFTAVFVIVAHVQEQGLLVVKMVIAL